MTHLYSICTIIVPVSHRSCLSKPPNLAPLSSWIHWLIVHLSWGLWIESSASLVQQGIRLPARSAPPTASSASLVQQSIRLPARSAPPTASSTSLVQQGIRLPARSVPPIDGARHWFVPSHVSCHLCLLIPVLQGQGMMGHVWGCDAGPD